MQIDIFRGEAESRLPGRGKSQPEIRVFPLLIIQPLRILRFLKVMCPPPSQSRASQRYFPSSNSEHLYEYIGIVYTEEVHENLTTEDFLYPSLEYVSLGNLDKDKLIRQSPLAGTNLSVSYCNEPF